MINISGLASNWTGYKDVLTIRCPQGVGTFLGIYDNDPTFPLVVKGNQYTSQSLFPAYVNNGNGYAGYFYYSGISTRRTWADSWNNWLITIESDGIWSGSIFFTSDRRIKTEIVDLSDEYTLDIIRKIPCREYHYKDILRRNNLKTIGYIAQEVKEHYPVAVDEEESYIPDKQQIAEDVIWEENGNKYLLSFSNYDVEVGTHVKFIGINYDGDKILKEDIYCSEKREDGKYLFENKYDIVIIYGKLVYDLNHVNKDKIFALHHSAIQELDRLQQEDKETINRLENEYNILINEDTELKNKNTRVLNENNRLKEKFSDLKTKLEELLVRINE